MKIKLKLTIYFTSLVFLIMLIFSVIVYYVSDQYKTDRFYTRISNRALTNARLLLEVVDVNDAMLRRINMNTISELAEEEISIFDSTGQCVYSKNISDTARLSRHALAGILARNGLKNKSGDRSEVFIPYRHNGLTYFVKVSAYDFMGNNYLHNLRNILAVGLISCLMLSMFGGYFFAFRTLLPINKIMDQVDQISGSSLHKRVSAGRGQDEIARLAGSFNQMLARLEHSFESQKMFVSGAAHEVRTPLTAITGQLEVALLREREKQEYIGILKSVLEEIRSLNMMSENLLELAQLSADFANFRETPVRVDEVVLTVRQELMKKYRHAEVEAGYIKMADDSRAFSVLGNENLLKVAFKNILDNACKFSGNHKVTVSVDYSGPKVIILIKDQGLGIPPGEMENIYKEFYRGSNTKRTKGYGIGLSIVRKIVGIHQGEISILSEEGKGTSVKVSFPNLLQQAEF